MSAAQEWLQDITRTQLHKFLVGMAPVKRVCKIVSAVSALLYGPSESTSSALAHRAAAAPGQYIPTSALATSSARAGAFQHHGGMVGGGSRVLAGARKAVRRSMVAAGRSHLLAQVGAAVPQLL
jgi:hypothetical protein